MHLFDFVVGMEAVEDKILCQGYAAREQGGEEDEDVLAVLHVSYVFESDENKTDYSHGCRPRAVAL